jgi:hypothetical protein
MYYMWPTTRLARVPSLTEFKNSNNNYDISFTNLTASSCYLTLQMDTHLPPAATTYYDPPVDE